MAFIIKQRVINTVIPDNDDNGLQDSIKVRLYKRAKKIPRIFEL